MAGRTSNRNRNEKKADTSQPPKSPSPNFKTGIEEKEENLDNGSLEKNQAATDLSNEKLSSEEGEEEKEEGVEEEEKKNHNTWVIAVVICSIVIAVAGVLYVSDYKLVWTNQPLKTVNSSSNPLVNPVENFKKEFKDLKSKFIAQDPDFWKRIKVPVLRVIRDEEPEYPAIVLLVVPKGESTSKTATCFAKRYRSIINKVYTGEEKLEKGYINVQKISKNSVEEFKYELDHEIKELFNSTKSEVHTIVIDHIEALDPNVMLLFHGYCDGDHAPYKKAMFVFVLHTDLETEKASEDLDKTVDHHLLSLWGKNLDKDKIPPLIARVANNKALIQEEHISSLTMSGC